MKTAVLSLRSPLRLHHSYTAQTERRPTELIVSIMAFILLAAMSTLVAREAPPAWEVTAFRFVNDLPNWLFPIIWPFMQYGVFVTIPIAAAVAFYFKRYRLATLLLIGGVGIYYLARVVKEVVPRGRPDALLEGIHARERFAPGSSGFTSGHTAVAATIATFSHYYLSNVWRTISLATLAVVVSGRIYIGGHLPLDVLGGVALGVGVASLINFIIGVPAGATVKEEDTEQWIKQHRPRHPGDLMRMALAATVFSGATFLAFSGNLSLLEESLFRVVNYLPAFLSPILQIIMQTGALYFVFVAATLALVFLHRRLAIKMLAGGVTVWWLTKLAKLFVDRDRPFYILSGVVERASNSGILGFPSGHAAVAALLATVASPYLKKSWSRVAWGAALTVALSRMYVGAHLPLDVLAGLSLGWFFGSLLNIVFGTPAKTWPRKAISRTLKEAGLPLVGLSRAAVDARGSTPLFAKTKTGQDIFIKLVDTEQRNADILFKLWRYLTLRGVEDEAPFANAKHLVEHEAYIAIQVAQADVRTPEVLVAAPVSSQAAVLVTRRLHGAVLGGYTGRVDEKLLRRIWREVKKLHEGRIAHRDLRAANVFVDKKEQPWMIDFSFAQAAATDTQLTLDIVELLASLSMVAGPKKTTRAAVRIMGRGEIKKTLPYLQPLALTSVTRKLLKSRPDMLAELSAEVQKQTNSLTPRMARLSRVDYRWFVVLGVAALTIYTFMPRLGELGNSIRALESIDLNWVFAALGASFLTYVMASVALIGSTAQGLPFVPTLILQAATTLVNRITPKSVGGIAMTEVYLEKHGLKRAEAIASISLVYVAGVLTHVTLLLTMIWLVGTADLKLGLIDGSSTKTGLLLAVVGGLAVAGIALIPKFKHQLRRFGHETFRGLKRGLTEPVKFLQIIGGSVGVTLAYALAFYASLEGFGSSVPFDTVLLVYLAGNVIAAASPTPGGLGATEATLVMGLTATGVPIGQAITGVLAFRLFTFWLPILPGFFAFRHLSKQLSLVSK